MKPSVAGRILRFLGVLFAFSYPAFADKVYFSPKGHIREQILQRIHHTKSTLDIAMYSLTSKEIADALSEAGRRRVKVRIIRDISQTKEKGDADPYLGGQNVEVRLLKGLGRGIMHDKFAVFDGKEGFTGSYNWTQNAELDNYENAFFFTDAQILAAYEKEFTHLWDIAQPIAIAGQTPSAIPGLFRDHPALSAFGLFVILLALGAAIAT
jgi:phosphatidylserine/phosphatidylglycerophosphate/cardiolipin synthase-like enzyme